MSPESREPCVPRGRQVAGRGGAAPLPAARGSASAPHPARGRNGVFGAWLSSRPPGRLGPVGPRRTPSRRDGSVAGGGGGESRFAAAAG